MANGRPFHVMEREIPPDVDGIIGLATVLGRERAERDCRKSRKPWKNLKPSMLVCFRKQYNSQEGSRLLCDLPPEIMVLVYTYVFRSQCSEGRPYDEHSIFCRPEYTGEEITYAALLRTCQKVYREAREYPYKLRRQTFYLCIHSRSPGFSARRPRLFPSAIQDLHHNYIGPPSLITSERIKKAWAAVDRRSGKTKSEVFPDSGAGLLQPQHVQVYAQAWALFGQLHHTSLFPLFLQIDPGRFYPKVITLTMRHTDFTDWEHDAPMTVMAEWIEQVCFPASVMKFFFELETTSRRSKQADWLADQIREKWTFRRADGYYLLGMQSSTRCWEGSSIFLGRRWTRDEIPEKPGRIRYHIATVTFRPETSETKEARLQLSPENIPLQTLTPPSDLVGPQIKKENASFTVVGSSLDPAPGQYIQR